MFLVKSLSLLPFWFLYALSELMAFLTYHIIGYRRKVVRHNLAVAFPEKSVQERRKIERQFYRNFLQITLESVKAYRFTKKDWDKRFKTTNPEVFLKYLDEGQAVILMSGHVANWEWPAFATGVQYPYPIEFIYKPIKNEKFNARMLQLRTRHGGLPIAKDQAVRQIIKRRKEPRIIGIIGDQLPAMGNEKYWIDFLNRETAFYIGAERIAEMVGYPVFTSQVKRVGLGRYEITYTQIGKPPYEKGNSQIIEKFAQSLEATIRQKPSDYLWSHKRWKYTKEEEEAVLASLKSGAQKS